MIRVCSQDEWRRHSSFGSLAWKRMAPILAMLLTLGPFPGRATLHSPPDWQMGGANEQPLKKQLAHIDYSLYHRSDILLEEVKALVVRHPEKMTMNFLKSATTGYSAEIAVVTFKSAGQGSNSNGKTRILLNFGQHGRELITSEVALRLLSVLAGEYNLQALDRSDLNNILQKLVIKVVPVENLNGRKIVEAGKLCERKNGRGVDINRNWGIDWGKKEKDYDPSEEYPGVAPFSEPETQIMRRLAYSFKPHFWVNVHSGMEALFMPYDHRNTTPNGTTAQLMKLMLQLLNHLHCKNNCVVGSGGASVGYLAHGTSTDYMYEIVKVPMAFTFEIYGEPKASSDDCFRMFNPTDLSVFESVLENWCAAFFTIFMISRDGLQNLSTKALDAQNVGYVSLLMNSQNQSSSYNYSYTERKVSRGRRSLGTNLDRKFEWATEEMRTLFEFFFISSTILLILICYKISKCISHAHAAFKCFYKPRS